MKNVLTRKSYEEAGNIEQVIMNPAINAKEATLQSGRLTIKSENVILDEDYWRNLTS